MPSTAYRRTRRKRPRRSFVNDPEIAFQYELCRKLGWRSVHAMMHGISRLEYVRWQAYAVYRRAEWSRLTRNGKQGQLVDYW